jgi:hypothetical protein
MARSTSLYFSGDFSNSSFKSGLQSGQQMSMTKSCTLNQINHAPHFGQSQSYMADLNNNNTNKQAANFSMLNNLRQNQSFYNCNTSQSFLSLGAMLGNSVTNSSLNNIAEHNQPTGWSGSGGYLNKAIGRPIRGGISTHGINNSSQPVYHKQPNQWPAMNYNNLDLNLSMLMLNNQLESTSISNNDQHSKWLANLESNSLLIPAYSEVNRKYQQEQLELLHLRQSQEEQQKMLLASLQFQLQQQQMQNLIASSLSSSVSSNSSISAAASSSNSNSFLPVSSSQTDLQ